MRIGFNKVTPRGIRLVFGLGPRTSELNVFLCAFVQPDQGKGEGTVPETVGIVRARVTSRCAYNSARALKTLWRDASDAR